LIVVLVTFIFYNELVLLGSCKRASLLWPSGGRIHGFNLKFFILIMFEILRAKLRKIKRRTKQIHLFLCRDAVTSPTCWQSQTATCGNTHRLVCA